MPETPTKETILKPCSECRHCHAIKNGYGVVHECHRKIEFRNSIDVIYGVPMRTQYGEILACHSERNENQPGGNETYCGPQAIFWELRGNSIKTKLTRWMRLHRHRSGGNFWFTRSERDARRRLIIRSLFTSALLGAGQLLVGTLAYFCLLDAALDHGGIKSTTGGAMIYATFAAAVATLTATSLQTRMRELAFNWRELKCLEDLQ